MKTRRSFLAHAAAPAVAISGFPTLVPASALGLNGATPPSDRVNFATIGVGWMGSEHVELFLKVPQVQYVAIADLDDEHLTKAKADIDLYYGNQDCRAFHAFEEVLAHRDIDAVSIAVPDHWHGLVATQAARAGKAIYCEKPLAHNFAEGRRMVEEARKAKTVWQTGSWQRSKENFRRGCELVRNGVIGKVQRVEVGLPAGHSDFGYKAEQKEFTTAPKTLWYDRWLGAASDAPYAAARVHKAWRWNYEYGGGQLMDWVGHHVDIAHWGLGFDETGPLTVEGEGTFPDKTALWNTATEYRVTCQYPKDITMVIAGGDKKIRSGTKWIGTDGWVWVDRKKIEASNPDWLKEEFDAGSIHLPKTTSHYHQFVECVKSGERTLTPAEVALHSATPGWLGNIAMFTGRKLQWNAERMEIVNDAGASKLLGREMRQPWHLG